LGRLRYAFLEKGLPTHYIYPARNTFWGEIVYAITSCVLLGRM